MRGMPVLCRDMRGPSPFVAGLCGVMGKDEGFNNDEFKGKAGGPPGGDPHA